MSVYIYKNLGRYNLAANTKEWQVYVRTDFGTVSELWDENDEPDIEGMLPSEVLDLIEERVRSYWLNTARESKLQTITDIRVNMKAVDREYLVTQIAHVSRQLKGLADQLADMDEE